MTLPAWAQKTVRTLQGSTSRFPMHDRSSACSPRGSQPHGVDLVDAGQLRNHGQVLGLDQRHLPSGQLRLAPRSAVAG